MPDFKVHFERRIDEKSKLGECPVMNAPSAEEAESWFLADVEEARGEFDVFDVEEEV